jgi:hypothetical protein
MAAKAKPWPGMAWAWPGHGLAMAWRLPQTMARVYMDLFALRVRERSIEDKVIV